MKVILLQQRNRNLAGAYQGVQGQGLVNCDLMRASPTCLLLREGRVRATLDPSFRRQDQESSNWATPMQSGPVGECLGLQSWATRVILAGDTESMAGTPPPFYSKGSDISQNGHVELHEPNSLFGLLIPQFPHL